MKNSTQLRIRLPGDLAQELGGLSPRARARVITLIMRGQMAGVKAVDLVAVHRNLVLVGHLLNQSLRSSNGKLANVMAVGQCVDLLKGLTR